MGSTVGRRERRPLIIASTATIFCLAMLLLSTQRSGGQVVNIANSACAPMHNICPNCAQTPNNIACTAPIPTTWTVGTCGYYVPYGQCNEWQNYSCGVQLVCTTGNPNGFNCNQAVTLCK